MKWDYICRKNIESSLKTSFNMIKDELKKMKAGKNRRFRKFQGNKFTPKKRGPPFCTESDTENKVLR